MSMLEDRFLSPSEVTQILNIPRHKLKYLFESRKLKAENFTKLGNGHFVFKESDLANIRQALFEVATK